MAPPIRIRPSFPLSQSLPSGSFQESFILLHQRAGRLKNHNHRKLTNLITWTTALSNSMKLWAMPFGPPKMDGSWWRVLTKHGPLEKGMADYFSILALRTPWTVWKGKKRVHWKMNSPGQQVPNMLLEIRGEITPERMKGWSQSENNTQLWMWLVMEVKSNDVKNITA